MFIKDPEKGTLMIFADCACATGFAQVTHNLIMNLKDRWNIVVVGINYHGDPHPIQEHCLLYSPNALNLSDYYGYGRAIDLIWKHKPHVILVINDPWVACHYLDVLNVPAKRVLYTPIDAENIKPMFGKPLNAFDHVIAYTEFGKQELLKAGVTDVDISVIPHGVNTERFYPIDQRDARQIKRVPFDWFIVQCVNRNSIRKRIDLAMYAFSEWVHRTNKPTTVKFHFHGALQDEGYDIVDLARRFDILDRLMKPPDDFHPATGMSEENMHLMYNIADIHMSMSVAEGWSLSVHESMASRVANLVPCHSALAEWPKGGVEYIKPSNIIQTSPQLVNTIGKIPDIESTIEGLEKLYSDAQYRASIADAGYKIAKQYKWNEIADKFHTVFDTLASDPSPAKEYKNDSTRKR